MAPRNTAAGLFGLLGRNSSPPASALLNLGSMGVVRHLTQEADRRVAASGGAPWTPSLRRAQRQAAAAVRRLAPRGSITRNAARTVAASSRPNAVERREMRRESYRQQGESLSDQQLMSIPASDLPPDLVRRRSEAMENRPRDEKGRFLPVGATSPAAPAGNAASVMPSGFDQQAAAERRQELEQKLQLVVGDLARLPPQVRHNLRGQIERQVAEEFAPAEEPKREKERWETFTGHVNREKPKQAADGAAAAESTPEPTPPPPPPQTPAQRKQEDVQAVVDAQLEDTPQPRQHQSEQPSGWLDKMQMGLDAVGIADPTPIADGTNAVISLGRAATDPKRRGEHLQNAAISTVSAVVPYVGDAAKLLKVGRAAKKAHAAQGVGRVAARGATQGRAESAAIGGAQAAIGGAQPAIGGAIRRMAGGAIGAMFGGGDRREQSRRADARRGSSAIDKVQMGLDVVGAVDPTPITDWVNGAISLGRAAIDPRRRGEHLQNAAISAVSGAIPYAGDSAKLLKLGRVAEKMDGVRGANRGAARGAEREAARDAFAGFASGGSGSPPADPPRYGAPSPAPGDDGDSPRRRREEAEGIAAADTFTDKLKTGALAIAGLAGKAYLAVEGLQLFNRGVLALNRGLAEYSGPLAGAYAKADNADIRRDMDRAGKLAGPLSRLQDETSELQDTISELVTPIQATLIEILATITQGTNLVAEIAKNSTNIGLLARIYDFIVGAGKEDAPGARQFLQDLSDGKFDGFGIDDVGKRFELLDRATRSQMGLTAQPKKPQKGKAPAPP